jgi:hypothetical protein
MGSMDRIGNGTAFRCGAFEAARIAVQRSNIFGNPHPEYEGERLALCLVPDIH